MALNSALSCQKQSKKQLTWVIKCNSISTNKTCQKYLMHLFRQYRICVQSRKIKINHENSDSKNTSVSTVNRIRYQGSMFSLIGNPKTICRFACGSHFDGLFRSRFHQQPTHQWQL